jgi:myo-inositol 2-dehydrogenase / D-chiro-inositol 1-dehydrogenase
MRRRDFMKNTATAAAAFGVPFIVNSSAWGRYRPNNKINIAQLGWGRIAMSHDVPETIKHDICRFTAVADPDINRARDGKKWIENYYAKKTGKEKYADVKVYQDYREMLMDPGIDAVVISTPDHWHAQPAMEAALKNMDVYLQKPFSLTIKEGRQLSDVVNKTGCILQVGSQQRSISPWPQFKKAAELVRNGVLGKLIHVDIGLGTDPGCGEEPEMPVPANLDYDIWLGSTEEVYYTEKRVHPQNNYGRPGWLRCRQFGAGMITGWGAHHIDNAHWGMGTEFTGPVELEGWGEFPDSGLWDVHGEFEVNTKYAHGVTMNISSKHPNGVKFIGEKGWITVNRGDVKVTSSDPDTNGGKAETPAIYASDPALLNVKLGPNALKLYESPEQHLDWLNCIQSRRTPVAPAEVGHRSCSACLLAHIAMQIPNTKLKWDPVKEEFAGNDTANSMLVRAQRKGYGTDSIIS